MCVHVYVCVIKSTNCKLSKPIVIFHSLLDIYRTGYQMKEGISYELKAEYKIFSLCKIHC